MKPVSSAAMAKARHVSRKRTRSATWEATIGACAVPRASVMRMARPAMTSALTTWRIWVSAWIQSNSRWG
jgi:hypothetical protein